MNDAETIRGKLSQLKAIDKRSLVSRTEWGNIDFSSAAKDIDAIYEIADILSDLPLERLPQNAAQQISDSLDRVLLWINKNNSFQLQDGVPTQKRDEIVNNIANIQNDFYQNSNQWIPFLAYLKGDIPAQLAQITSSVAQASQAYSDFDKYTIDQRAEIDRIVKATREAAAEAGVASFTDDFLRDADQRENDAGTWLTRSTWAAVVTLVVAILMFFFSPYVAGSNVVQYVTSKLIILILLLGVTAWCAGNYKANKHQATVSRFKAHALKTFQAFVLATENEAIKDAVLLETTRSIFTHAQSGYLRSEHQQDGSSRILEVVKGFTSPGSTSSPA